MSDEAGAAAASGWRERELERMSRDSQRLAELEQRVEALTIALRELVSHGAQLNAEQRAALDRARDVLAAD